MAEGYQRPLKEGLLNISPNLKADGVCGGGGGGGEGGFKSAADLLTII